MFVGTVTQIDDEGSFVLFPDAESRQQIEVAILNKAAHYYIQNLEKFKADSSKDDAMGEVEFSLEEARAKRDRMTIFSTFV